VADDPVAQRIAQGLARVGSAMRHGAWRDAGAHGLTPTQVQILGVLHARPDPPLLGQVAKALAITPATASEAVRVLVEKGLVRKRPAKTDGRGVALLLTRRGRVMARQVAGWPEFLVQAVDELDAAEQSVLLRALIRMIRSLQERGVISVQRMCVECRFFAPHVYKDAARPHHCHFVDAPFGDGDLRIDCADMQPVAPEVRPKLWELFVHGNPAAAKRGKTAEGV